MADKLTASAQGYPKADYLAAARAAARWIVNRQSKLHWPRRSDELVDLYYGSAGIILFFRELAESTGEHRTIPSAPRRGVSPSQAAHSVSGRAVVGRGGFRGASTYIPSVDIAGALPWR
jgi:hypothetical protein